METTRQKISSSSSPSNIFPLISKLLLIIASILFFSTSLNQLLDKEELPKQEKQTELAKVEVESKDLEVDNTFYLNIVKVVKLATFFIIPIVHGKYQDINYGDQNAGLFPHSYFSILVSLFISYSFFDFSFESVLKVLFLVGLFVISRQLYEPLKNTLDYFEKMAIASQKYKMTTGRIFGILNFIFFVVFIAYILRNLQNLRFYDILNIGGFYYYILNIGLYLGLLYFRWLLIRFLQYRRNIWDYYISDGY